MTYIVLDVKNIEPEVEHGPKLGIIIKIKYE